MATEEHVRAALRAVWHANADTCTAATTGLDQLPGSRWLLTIGGTPYTARIVAASHRQLFVASLAAVVHLAEEGIAVGMPRRTADGALAVTTHIGEMAVVADPPGRPLDGADPIDQHWWGDLLGRAHRVLQNWRPGPLGRIAWPDPAAAHVAAVPWMRPAFASVVAAVTRLTVTDQLTYGVLHGDPRPELFRMDIDTGRSAIMSWGEPVIGPLAYDVAAAAAAAVPVDAASGALDRVTDLIDAYVASSPVSRDELESALPVMLRVRWARVADRYARRIFATGSTVPLPRSAALVVANLRDGLEEARGVLAALADGA